MILTIAVSCFGWSEQMRCVLLVMFYSAQIPIAILWIFIVFFFIIIIFLTLYATYTAKFWLSITSSQTLSAIFQTGNIRFKMAALVKTCSFSNLFLIIVMLIIVTCLLKSSSSIGRINNLHGLRISHHQKYSHPREGLGQYSSKGVLFFISSCL